MAHLPVQCQNCGARYKIPETFKGDSAKCKACGTQIDIAAARSESEGADASAEEDAAPAKASNGGTRRPRTTGGKSSRASAKDSGDDDSGSRRKRSSRRGAKAEADAEEETGSRSKRSSRRGASAVKASGSSRRRRGEEADDEEEEEGGRRYQRQKDNTPMIMISVIGGLAVIAVILLLVWNSGEDDKSAEDPKKTAESTEDADAKKADAAAKAAEAAAAKADAAAKEASAKKKKPKKKPKKKTRREQLIKKEEEIKTAADIFQPSKHPEALPKLPIPESVTEADQNQIAEFMEGMKDSGFQGSKARNKLTAMGITVVPIIVNKMLTLDFASASDNQYCFDLGEAVRKITDEQSNFESPLPGEDLDIKMAHRNASEVWEVHYFTRRYWHSEAGMKKYLKAYKKTGKPEK